MARKRSSKKKELYFVAVIVAAVAVVAGTLFFLPSSTTSQPATVPNIVIDVDVEVDTLPDGTKFIVNPSDILSGGPPQGGIGIDVGIPAIADPRFVSVEEADTFLADDAIVFGVVVDGEARAYTKEVLVFHEIANDMFGDKPVIVTYCPLCGTAIAFDPTIEGEVSRFGTSGKLYNSNLVMYDELTGSYWTQVGGRAIIGPLSGFELGQIPIDTLLYKDWKRLHPDTIVLSRDTGFARPYGIDPYGDYYIDNRRVGFGVSFSDTRLNAKDIVAGIKIGDLTKAYAVLEVDKVDVINDQVGSKPVLVTKDPTITIVPEVNPVQVFERDLEGQVLEFEIVDGKLLDVQTGTEWDFNTGKAIDGDNEGKELTRIIRESDFWFNWVAFHPDTEVFKA